MKYIKRVSMVSGSPFLLLATLLILTGCSNKRMPDNLILISIDTLRPDHLGCYGYDRPTSPSLDTIALDGLLFEDASSSCPWTFPAHTSMLTGRYPSHSGVTSPSHRLDSNITTLAERLAENGFRTSAVVNSHWLSDKRGLHQGFEDFEYVLEDVARVEPTGITEQAIKWLKIFSKEEQQRFFLFLHYYDVHSDYSSLPEYEERFVKPYKGNADGSTNKLLSFRNGYIKFNDRDARHLIDLYDAGILQIDNDIAQLFEFIEKQGLFDNTLVIVTSDHGEEFLEHGGVLHGQTHFQEVIRVPLIMKGPGIPKGRRIKDLVSVIDIVPTVLSLLGANPLEGIDGIDLSTFWTEEKIQKTARYLYSEADWNIAFEELNAEAMERINAAGMSMRKLRKKGKNGKVKLGEIIVDDIKRSIRLGRYVLHYDRLLDEIELYDLQNDSAEKNNVASRHSRLVEELLLKLEDFMESKRETKESVRLLQEEIERLKSLGYFR